MLGAKARAAEYNAAKAASARQASREAEDQRLPPKTTPVSLSAYTKVVSVNRNKGTKSYKPLVLSDSTEDDRSMSSLDIPLGDERSLSSPIMNPPPRRPASLPSSNPSSFKHFVYDHDPFGMGYCAVPSAPRAMLSIDEHAIFDHNIPMHIPSAPLFAMPQTVSSLVTHPITPLQYTGWCFPHLDLEWPVHLQYFPNAGIPPDLSNSEPRIVHRYPLSDMEPHFQAENEEEDKVDGINSESPTRQDETNGTKLHIFGPDDITPAKMEVKQALRREWLEAHGDACFSPEMTSTSDKGQTQRSPEDIREFTTQEVPHSPTPYYIQHWDTLTRHEIVESMLARDEREGRIIHQPEEKNIFRITDPFRSQEDSPGPVLSTRTPMPVALPLGSDSSTISPKSRPNLMRSSRMSSQENQNSRRTRRISDMVDPRVRDKLLVHSRLDCHDRQQIRHETLKSPFAIVNKHNHSVQYPLIDIHTDDWCKFDPLIAGDKKSMREFFQTARAALTIDTGKGSLEKMQGIDSCAHEAEEHLRSRLELQDMRRKKVKKLADEIQQKWQDAMLFGLAYADHSEPLEAARRFKAIGNVMVALSQYAHDFQEPRASRTRSYGTVPDYATEKGVQMSQEGSRSLFETEDGENNTAPARIARDPRYRPRNMDLPAFSECDKIARLLSGRARL